MRLRHDEVGVRTGNKAWNLDMQRGHRDAAVVRTGGGSLVVDNDRSTSRQGNCLLHLACDSELLSVDDKAGNLCAACHRSC